MTISNNWTEWIGELSKTRKVIALEMQGHGHQARSGRTLPKTLGTFIKASEVQYHHEVTNQFLWSQF